MSKTFVFIFGILYCCSVCLTVLFFNRGEFNAAISSAMLILAIACMNALVLNYNALVDCRSLVTKKM